MLTLNTYEMEIYMLFKMSCFLEIYLAQGILLTLPFRHFTGCFTDCEAGDQKANDIKPCMPPWQMSVRLGGGDGWLLEGSLVRAKTITIRASNIVSISCLAYGGEGRQHQPLSHSGASLLHVSGQQLVILGFLFLNQIKKKLHTHLWRKMSVLKAKKPQKYKKRPPGHVTG